MDDAPAPAREPIGRRSFRRAAPTPPRTGGALELDRLAVAASAGRPPLDGLSFSLPPGEITALLGTGGAGQTSLLGALAGTLRAAAGRILLDGAEVQRLPPARRDVAAALGPVPLSRASVAAATRALAGRTLKRKAAAASVAEALERTGLAALAGERVARLGEPDRRRVALAGALARPIGLLLLDEPLLGLDPLLRRRLAETIRGARGRGVVLATQDIELASSLADRLLVLAAGRLAQLGSPAELYDRPASVRIATLLGEANILSGRVREKRQGGFVWTEGGRFVQQASPGEAALGGLVTLCLRPERVALLLPGEAADNVIEGETISLRRAGPLAMVRVRTALGEMLAATPSWRARFEPAPGETVRLAWSADAASILPEPSPA